MGSGEVGSRGTRSAGDATGRRRPGDTPGCKNRGVEYRPKPTCPPYPGTSSPKSAQFGVEKSPPAPAAASSPARSARSAAEPRGSCSAFARSLGRGESRRALPAPGERPAGSRARPEPRSREGRATGNAQPHRCAAGGCGSRSAAVTRSVVTTEGRRNPQKGPKGNKQRLAGCLRRSKVQNPFFFPFLFSKLPDPQ